MTTQKTSAVILADNLSASYGSRSIWKDASFSVHRGEFVALLGPNGAGKTTLFRQLLGLETPSGGKLSIFHEPAKRGNPRIGYIPQRHHVDTDMHIEALEMVQLGLSGLRWGFSSASRLERDRTESLAALGMVDGIELARRPLGELSGGELQRVFLAQALVGKPDILLLDEPLANLDLRRETELVQLIHSVAHDRHMAVLLIAHNINPLLPFVDKIIYIVNGRVATGAPEKIITTETLSNLYDAPIEVLKDSRGRIAVLGSEEAEHHV